MRAHWIIYCKVICKMNNVKKGLRKLTFMVSLSFSLSWKEEQIKGERGICLNPSFSLFKVRFLFQLCIFLQIKQHFVPYIQKMPSTPTQTIWYKLFSPIVFQYMPSALVLLKPFFLPIYQIKNLEYCITLLSLLKYA